MLQINAAIPSLQPLPGAGAEAERVPGDGFEALLAGLMGTVQPPTVPPEPGRILTAAPPQTPDPEAAAGEGPGTADAEAAGAATTDGMGDQAPPARPAVPQLDAGPLAASSATSAAPHASARPAEPAPPADGAETLPRAPAATLPGAVQLPDRQGSTVTPARPMPERQMPSPSAEAVERTARDGVPPLQHDQARAEAALRLPPDAAGRPVWLGSVFTGGRSGFAQLTLTVDWQEPGELDAARGLAALSGQPLRGEAITAETAAVRASAAPPVQQLAAAIERAVGGDLQRLTIQLSPEALGSIEIALELDAERRLSVAIMAERPETVELLRGEARELQRLLAQQGIDLGDAGLELGLMGGERRDRQPAGDDETAGEAEPAAVEAQLLAVPLPGAAPSERDPVGRPGRLNLSI